MQDKSSRTKPVIVGFSLCLLLICAVAFAAHFSIQATRLEFARSSDEVAALMQTASAMRQFDEAQIAALRFRETNEKRFVETVHLHIHEAEECMNEVQWNTYIDTNLRIISDLFDQFQIFAVLFKEDFAVSEQIKQMTESTDDWKILQEERQNLRAEQDKIAEEIKKMGEELWMFQNDFYEQSQQEAAMLFNYTMVLLLISTFVAIVVGIGTCFVVVRMIGRESLPLSSYDFSYSEPSADLRVVADRLQEVVNLLRK